MFEDIKAIYRNDPAARGLEIFLERIKIRGRSVC